MMELIFFLLGIHICIMLLAACYRIVDLWYRIGDYIGDIILRLLVLAAMDAGLILALPIEWQTAFIYGQVAYLILHIVLFCLTRFLIMIMESRYR